MSRDDFSLGARYLRAAAENRGWEVTLHPDGAFAGRITLPDGTSRFFIRSSYDINTSGATQVARDKALTKFFLERLGYPVLPGRAFFSESLAQRIGSDRTAVAACAYAAELGFPVMVKVNSGSGGEGIERVESAEEMEGALSRVLQFGDVVLIEPYVHGLRDYRLLVLEGEVILSYERRPFAVEGDGRSTIRELVEGMGHCADAQRTGKPDDKRLGHELNRLGRTWSDVLERGQSLRLLDVANLSQGGSAFEVEVGSLVATMAVDAARDMGLRFCGVDILTDGANTHWILELNGTPTIHQFATLCRMSEERLAALFERVLLAMVAA